MNSLADPYPAAVERQHPYGNLQPLPGVVDDRNRAISPLRLAKDLNGGPIERVKRIENLDLSVFRTQGIVGVDVLIPMSTTSFPPAASLPTAPDGSIPRRASSFPSRHLADASAASSGQGFVNSSSTTGSSCMARCSSLPCLADSAASSGNSASRTGGST